MSADQLAAIAGVLLVLLGVSEALPFVQTIKANSWGQILIAVLKAVAASGKGKR